MSEDKERFNYTILNAYSDMKEERNSLQAKLEKADRALDEIASILREFDYSSEYACLSEWGRDNLLAIIDEVRDE